MAAACERPNSFSMSPQPSFTNWFRIMTLTAFHVQPTSDQPRGSFSLPVLSCFEAQAMLPKSHFANRAEIR